MSACCSLRKCPAGFYLRCPGYAAGTSCWETMYVPCCRRNDKKRCERCTLFLAHLIGSTKQVYPNTIQIGPADVA